MKKTSADTDEGSTLVVDEAEAAKDAEIIDHESEATEAASAAHRSRQAGPESDAATSDDDRARPSGRRRWAGIVALGVVVAVMATSLVFAVIFGWKLKNRDDLDDAARQAAAAAANYAVTLTSIDSRHIDQNFAGVLAGATGEFKDMYSHSSDQLKTLLVQNNASSQGRVVDSSVKSATINRVVVLLFVDQTVTNTMSPDPRVDRSRIVMTMDRVSGRWLASKVDMA